MDKLHFADPTEITCPFGLLDEDTQQRLRNWPHGWEFVNGLGQWAVCRLPSFCGDTTYRARPAPLVPDYVDWSQVGPVINYFARDADERLWAFEYEPRRGPKAWHFGAGHALANANNFFPSYRPGTVDWRDSLLCRPGVEA